MKEIICYTSYLPEGAEQNITFMELLLNEHWAEGNIECPEEVFSAAGNINTRLTAKQNYEFLLRAVKNYPLKAVGIPPHTGIPAAKTISPFPPGCPDGMPLPPGLPHGSASQTASLPAGYLTDCYIAGKYQQELLASGYFDLIITALLKDAGQLPDPKEASVWLEKMISHAPEYYEIDDNTCPILIYRGNDTCYNTLNLFAEELAKAFRSCRQQVEIFDIEKEGHPALTRLIHRRFKAVIGIQTHVFSVMMQDNRTNLHDLIHGPKYNMILDHPAWMKEHIEHGPKDYYLLIHDRNYLSFAKRYFKNIKNCIYFPPGGILPASMHNIASALPEASRHVLLPHPFPKIQIDIPEKKYDITFIGSYRDYRERLAMIRAYDRPLRFLTARYLRIMRKNPDYPAEKAFGEVLEYYHIHLNDEEFLDLFFETRQACFCIMIYYRERIIRTLLHAGIEIHVYGDSWKSSPFAGHECLHCHPSLDAKESLEIMEQSKISLNIMSWHKDGLTERVLNAMLCRSAVLSDRSTILEEEFVPGKDLLLFSLTELDTLPALVKSLLEDDKKLQEITWNGYCKVLQNHQWVHRAWDLCFISL